MLSRLTTFDYAKLLGYVITLGTGLPTVLAASGLFSANTLTHVLAVISLIVGLATLIANTIKNPSAPSGTVSANIPVGTVPVVTPATTPPANVAPTAQKEPTT